MAQRPVASRRFAEMTHREKFAFILKVAVCLLSFGFIYPNILHD
jgi:hypothetical protein